LEVESGSANDGRVEIVTGLKGGERVVVSPPAELRDRQLVKVAE
jgi:multidrug efflux pump subunit AcrA (membrane-fusion protein)